MLNCRQNLFLPLSRRPLRMTSAAQILVSLVLVWLMVAAAQEIQAQTYTVIHDFTGGQDGAYPFTGLAVNARGSLYGTAYSGGRFDSGSIYSLNASGSHWIFNPLYSFGGSDGAGPIARLVVGPDGGLYGSTSAGGGGPCTLTNGYRGCGTIYELRPPAHAQGSALVAWDLSVLYRFSGTDGAYPQGELTFDQAGNIYGTTVNGGSAGWGTIYSLTPSTGGWTQELLYQAQDDGDGQYPWGGVVFDQAGNLYGVFSSGGPHGYGAVYELTPSGSGWSESTVHAFRFLNDDGAIPQGRLVFDDAGNMYGTTVHNAGGGGTAFELTNSGGGWSYNFLYSFTGGISLGPYSKLTRDAEGNLYGTTFGDGRYGFGSVFKMTRSGGDWSYTSLHDFTGGSDGGNPACGVTMDSQGNLYGTASDGGAYGMGVVFQITP